MKQIELIYDADCPNAGAARNQLRRTLQQLGQPAEWKEWNRAEAEIPAYARQFGSPTILVDGRDVTGGGPSEHANCCRLYRTANGSASGIPPAEAVAAALGGAGSYHAFTSSRFRSSLAVVPAVGLAVLPKLACPACWPAYAGVLGSLGLGFLADTAYLFPLTAVFLAIAVAALGYRARNRHGLGPLTLGLLAAATVLIGKFQLESNVAMYGGVALLVGASLWNAWPSRKVASSCSACTEGDRLNKHHSQGDFPWLTKNAK